MSWESFTDAIVNQAMRDGEFASLSGAGQPIKGLDEPYRDDWWLKAYLKREELSLPCGALELRAEVERGLLAIMKLSSESAVRRKVDQLNERIAKVNSTTTSGPATSMGKLDVDAIVARWRVQREARC
ncbi:MAG: DnaJ family domain-containing protein [Tepidisphaeraceae bacterium]